MTGVTADRYTIKRQISSIWERGKVLHHDSSTPVGAPGNVKYRLIDDVAGLSAVVDDLSQQQHVSLDTEFMRVDTFYPQLCLLQVRGRGCVYCVDALALNDLSALAAVLVDPTVEKIVHAGQQDIEVIKLALDASLLPIFDTQRAAAFLGLPEQISYARIVADRFGVVLDKSLTRADWQRRPLAPAAVRYAALDVWFLQALRDVLVEELSVSGKLAWFSEDSRAVRDIEIDAPVEDAWLRVKGITGLAPADFACAVRLAAWREREARRRNRPRAWVLRDKTLRAIACAHPRDPVALAAIPDVRPALLRHHGSELVALLQQAPSGLEKRPKPLPRLTHRGRQLVKELLTVVQETALEHLLAPSVLASRKSLQAAVAGQRDLPLFHGWRRDVIGLTLLQRLADHAPETLVED